ncbi:MAG: EutN/CcmL family microcompartment protein [Gemmatimonadota bacterium]|jgi:ethanolamine utilization protein EutN|nr:EutN/CcmL family microcompartment protein [Gemmatimonadota bacterium]MDP6529976.1 EutN/CcmL family microcompartment protein [Gemmatimonadota bacterium]MDP6802119.1 EutN/CcmL family microcompartment protein [Gemmatimonadota bacterium]MDP7032054.1 EutN/CcmL family microcompartment protein [Gemmatimonadota bacterium]
MNLARVIGTVWATRKNPRLEGFRFLVIQPEDERGKTSGAPLIAADQVSARAGDRVFFVLSREAAKAFPGKCAPVDAAILGIVDDLSVEEELCPEEDA